MAPWNSDAESSKINKHAVGEHGKAWRHLANSVLAKTGDEARAIREANSVLAHRVATRGPAKKRFGKKT